MKLVTNAARRSQCRSRTGGPSLSLLTFPFLCLIVTSRILADDH
jgi:hypothetical protein